MKIRISILLALIVSAIAIAQSGKGTLTSYDTLSDLLSVTPAKSEYMAVICGITAKTNSDGFLLYYIPTAITETNNSIFMPVSGIGRWFKITSTSSGETGAVAVGFSFPNNFDVQPPIATNGDVITIRGQITNALSKVESGGLEAAVATVDYVPSGLISTGGLTMNTAKLLGRALTAGAVQEFGVGTGLLLSSGVLSGTFYVDVQMFTNAGTYTWTNPPNSIASYVYVVGGGQGGWAGYPIDTNSLGSLGDNANTGAGGNGGGISEVWFRSLPDTMSVTVGAGGNGGIGSSTTASSTVKPVMGATSFIGYDPVFGYTTARGGGTNQSCIVGCSDGSGAGGTRGGFGGASGNDETLANPGFGYGTNNATGGGGAGGLLDGRGAPSIANWSGYSLTTLGGPAGQPGTNGFSGGPFTAGYGGSGGGGSLTGNGGNGGDGGWPGGGGGGGGNCQTNSTSGNGGRGADGFVGIITIGFR